MLATLLSLAVLAAGTSTGEVTQAGPLWEPFLSDGGEHYISYRITQPWVERGDPKLGNLSYRGRLGIVEDATHASDGGPFDLFSLSVLTFDSSGGLYTAYHPFILDVTNPVGFKIRAKSPIKMLPFDVFSSPSIKEEPWADEFTTAALVDRRAPFNGVTMRDLQGDFHEAIYDAPAELLGLSKEEMNLALPRYTIRIDGSGTLTYPPLAEGEIAGSSQSLRLTLNSEQARLTMIRTGKLKLKSGEIVEVGSTSSIYRVTRDGNTVWLQDTNPQFKDYVKIGK